MTDPIDRPHVYLPVFGDDGHLLQQIIVQPVDPATGAEVFPVAWVGPSATAQQQPFPATFAPGIIDLWLDKPGRFDLHVTTTTGSWSTVFSSVDFLPDPNNQIANHSGLALRQVSPIETGAWVRFDENGTISFVQPPLVQPHQHEGVNANTVVLNTGSPADQAANESLVGHASGTSLSAADSGATSLGDSSSAVGSSSVALGSSAATTDVQAVALGTSATAAYESVSIGSFSGQNISEPGTPEITLSVNSTGTSDAYVNGSALKLRQQVASNATQTSLGSSVAIPATPSGVTSPLWLLGQENLAPNALTAQGAVQIGSVGSAVGFYGSSGAAKSTADFSGQTGALESLLAALGAYGLLPYKGAPANLQLNQRTPWVTLTSTQALDTVQTTENFYGPAVCAVSDTRFVVTTTITESTATNPGQRVLAWLLDDSATILDSQSVTTLTQQGNSISNYCPVGPMLVNPTTVVQCVDTTVHTNQSPDGSSFTAEIFRELIGWDISGDKLALKYHTSPVSNYKTAWAPPASNPTGAAVLSSATGDGWTSTNGGWVDSSGNLCLQQIYNDPTVGGSGWPWRRGVVNVYAGTTGVQQASLPAGADYTTTSSEVPTVGGLDRGWPILDGYDVDNQVPWPTAQNNYAWASIGAWADAPVNQMAMGFYAGSGSIMNQPVGNGATGSNSGNSNLCASFATARGVVAGWDYNGTQAGESHGVPVAAIVDNPHSVPAPAPVSIVPTAVYDYGMTIEGDSSAGTVAQSQMEPLTLAGTGYIDKVGNAADQSSGSSPFATGYTAALDDKLSLGGSHYTRSTWSTVFRFPAVTGSISNFKARVDYRYVGPTETNPLTDPSGLSFARWSDLVAATAAGQPYDLDAYRAPLVPVKNWNSPLLFTRGDNSWHYDLEGYLFQTFSSSLPTGSIDPLAELRAGNLCLVTQVDTAGSGGYPWQLSNVQIIVNP